MEQKQYRKSSEIISQVVVYSILFLLALNFMNWFYRIFLLLAALIFIVSRKNIYTHKAFSRIIMLLSFACVYLFVYGQTNGTNPSKVIVLLSFPIMFMLGNSFRTGYGDWETPIWIVIFGLAMHGTLNFFSNFSTLASSTVRETVDIWLHSEWILTGQICLFILIAGTTYYAFFCLKFKDNPFLKVIWLFFFVIGMVYNILGATRTVVYAAFLDIVICMLLMMFKYQRNLKQRFRYILVALIVLVGIYFLYEMNMFGIKEWYMQSPLYLRNQMLNTATSTTELETRQGQIIAALKQIFVHPWGGYTMEFSTSLEFIHNTWLNIAYGEGIIAAILFFVYCILSLKDVVTVIKYGKSEKNVLFVTGLFVVTMVYWSLEPVCEAAPSSISLFCFIHGYVIKCLERRII